MAFDPKESDKRTMFGDTTLPSQRRGHLILVVGAPGAGKGTMCKLLASDGELPTICKPGTSAEVHHISVGDLLRREKARGALPPEVTENVEKQILMDGRKIVKIIASTGVEEVLGRGEVVILDGFPRNLDQLHAFREKFGQPDLIVSLECQRQVALQRYLGRHDANRPDGDVALFEKRCDEFERENPGILDYYRAECDGRVIEVDVGSLGRSIDENYNTLKQSLVQSQRGPWYKKGD